MMTIDIQVKAWAAEASHAFQFLETLSYRAQTPQLDVAWGSLNYIGTILGVRLEVETDGFSMYVALFRPSRPDHDNSVYLQTCLQRLGLSIQPLEQIRSLKGDFDNCKQIVTLFASALRLNLATLESSVDALFPKK